MSTIVIVKLKNLKSRTLKLQTTTNEVQKKQRLTGAVPTPDMVPYDGLLYTSPNHQTNLHQSLAAGP